MLKMRGTFLAVADVGCSSHFSVRARRRFKASSSESMYSLLCGLIYLLLAHAMRRAPIVVQFYLVVVVAVAGTFFCGAAGAGLTAGVAGFGLFATTGAV
jgi:hypothetical protein